MAVEFNPTTSEPFLRLPPIPKLPNRSLIITPHRLSDGPSNTASMNHPSVYKNLSGPPYPYTEADFTAWFKIVSEKEKKSFDEYLAVETARKNGGAGPKWVGTGQFGSVIRDEETGEMIGDIQIRRKWFSTVVDMEEKERLKKANAELEAGSPEIQWEMGFYLSPAAQGYGIMTVALATLREKYFIPYMNTHIITGNYFDFNIPSMKTFEKAGFVFEEIFPDIVELPEVKYGVKGKKCGLGVMRWVRGDVETS